MGFNFTDFWEWIQEFWTTILMRDHVYPNAQENVLNNQIDNFINNYERLNNNFVYDYEYIDLINKEEQLNYDILILLKNLNLLVEFPEILTNSLEKTLINEDNIFKFKVKGINFEQLSNKLNFILNNLFDYNNKHIFNSIDYSNSFLLWEVINNFENINTILDNLSLFNKNKTLFQKNLSLLFQIDELKQYKIKSQNDYLKLFEFFCMQKLETTDNFVFSEPNINTKLNDIQKNTLKMIQTVIKNKY